MSTLLTAQEIWSRIRQECEGRLSQQTITTWLDPSRAVSVMEEAVTVELKNKFTAYYVEQNYQGVLNRAAEKILERPFRVNFIYREGENEQIDLWRLAEDNDEERQDDGNGGQRQAAVGNPGGQGAQTPSLRKPGQGRGKLNPRYTFENFVVGKNSQFANAAARSVAENPGSSYNPLFIYGGVGLGKTHLMQAIGHHLISNGQAKPPKICYISAEEFLNELVRAITDGSTLAFRNRYRQMDALLIDDVEFLAKKEGTQEEFFHTFNTLYESQKQIVLTSDRSPREIHHLEERLRSRFQWGLVTDIQPPEYETRVAILKKKSSVDNLLIPENVLEYIAESVTGNVRLLECSLNSLKHYSNTQHSQINLELARRALESIFEQEKNQIRVEDIIALVSDGYGVPVESILSAKRKKSFVEPRQVAMYICNKLTKLSYPETAECFKRKDHTTVIHAVKKITRICDEDEVFKERVVSMMDKLRNQSIKSGKIG